MTKNWWLIQVQILNPNVVQWLRIIITVFCNMFDCVRLFDLNVYLLFMSPQALALFPELF